MKNDDELDLWRAIRHAEAHGLDLHHREVAELLDIPPGRAHYLFQKWARRGYLEYGINAGLGWLTQYGRESVLTRHRNLEPDWNCRARVRAYR